MYVHAAPPFQHLAATWLDFIPAERSLSDMQAPCNVATFPVINGGSDEPEEYVRH